jgi:hypothetical protein
MSYRGSNSYSRTLMGKKSVNIDGEKFHEYQQK